jgi:phosphate starvation-inducible PhoH-like protein
VSGLADAADRLRGIKGVGIVFLDKSDIVRHPLVQAIVNAYEGPEQVTGESTGARSNAEPESLAGGSSASG